MMMMMMMMITAKVAKITTTRTDKLAVIKKIGTC